MFGVTALFGYDVFISYRHADAADYATALRNQLVAADFSCFLDQDEAPPGEELTPTIERALQSSRLLVLVGTSGALGSPWIVKELTTYLKAHRNVWGSCKLVAINVGSALRGRSSEFAFLDEYIWINEDSSAVAAGAPSTAVYVGVQKAFAYTKRNTMRRRAVVAAMVLLSVFAIGAIWQSIRATRSSLLANEQKRKALRILEWVVSETVHYDLDQLNPDSLPPEAQNILRGLLTRLTELGFVGQVLVAGNIGEFCVAPGSTDEYGDAKAEGTLRLASAETPIANCEKFPSAEYAIGAADRQASALRNFLETIPRPETIKIETISYGKERPRYRYPEKGTSAEWNAVARLNNGISIQLTER
jgi:TIR domain